MPKDENINAYRMLDASLGEVEMLARVHHEQKLLRKTIVQNQILSLQGWAVVSLTLTITAGPAVYAIWPNSWKGEGIAAAVAMALFFACAVFLVVQIVAGRKEKRQLSEILPERLPRDVETTPEFLMILASAAGTRLSSARKVLSEDGLSDITRSKFDKIVEYYLEVLDDVGETVDELYEDRVISESEVARVKDWLESAKVSSD